MVEPRAGEVGRRALDVEAPVRRLRYEQPLLSFFFFSVAACASKRCGPLDAVRPSDLTQRPLYCRCMHSSRAGGCGARCVRCVWLRLGPAAPSSLFRNVRRWWSGSGRARCPGGADRLTAGLVGQEAAAAAAPSAPVAPSREEDAPASTSGSSDSGSDAREEVELLKGWRSNDGVRSLPEVNGTIAVPAASRPWFAQLAAFAGIGSMISVGYMVRLLLGSGTSRVSSQALPWRRVRLRRLRPDSADVSGGCLPGSTPWNLALSATRPRARAL